MQAKSFSLGAQEYLLEAVAVRCGDDLTVVIGGGEKQHIGAVAVGVPRPSLKDKNIVSSSASGRPAGTQSRLRTGQDAWTYCYSDRRPAYR